MATLVNGTWQGGMGIAGTTGSVFAAAVVGKDLYIGGSFAAAGGTPARNFAGWSHANGQWSPLWDTDNTIKALMWIDGTHLCVAGDFNQVGSGHTGRNASRSIITAGWQPPVISAPRTANRRWALHSIPEATGAMWPATGSRRRPPARHW